MDVVKDFTQSINNDLANKKLGLNLKRDLTSEKLGLLKEKYKNINCKCQV